MNNEQQAKQQFDTIFSRVETALQRYEDANKDIKDPNIVLQNARDNWEQLDEFTTVKQVNLLVNCSDDWFGGKN